MPIFASNFTANSLQGTVQVIGGQANIVLPISNFAFEGAKSFVIDLRKEGYTGTVIGTSNVISIPDTTTIVSLTANIATVAEGNAILYTLTTTNVVNGTNVFFSTNSVVTANVNSNDFVGGNTGVITINNNVGTLTLVANADVSNVSELAETFALQIRTNNTAGNIVVTSSNVLILDTSNTYAINSLVESSNSIVTPSNVTFTVSVSNIPAGTTLYYDTVGTATTNTFIGGNTGSFRINTANAGTNTVVLGNLTLGVGGSGSFALNIRRDSTTGTILATSNTIVISGLSSYYSMTGGNITYSNQYKIHTFTSSTNSLVVSGAAGDSLNSNVDVLMVGGGGGGGGTGLGGGGGAGGVTYGSVTLQAATYTVVVGAGGTNPGADVQYTGGQSRVGNNTTFAGGNYPSGLVIAYGGGGGAPFVPGQGTGGSGGGGYDAPQGSGQPSAQISGAPIGIPSIIGYGNSGGNGYLPSPISAGPGGGGGGGGGAGAAGIPGGQYSGQGGIGRAFNISGSNVFYGGGGGGGNYYGPYAVGGQGGGGQGGENTGSGSITSNNSRAGTVNTGGGGGGGSYGGWPGNNGGSGIVIVRYPYTAYYANVVETSNLVGKGTNVTFNLSASSANAITLYYSTLGNVDSSHFIGGNTGSFVANGTGGLITLQTNFNTILDGNKRFALQVRTNNTAGNVVVTSGNVFLTNSVAVSYLLVGGGGGGQSTNYNYVGGGGGGGGVLTGNTYLTSGQTYTITVGAGGFDAASNPMNGYPGFYGGTGGSGWELPTPPVSIYNMGTYLTGGGLSLTGRAGGGGGTYWGTEVLTAQNGGSSAGQYFARTGSEASPGGSGGGAGQTNPFPGSGGGGNPSAIPYLPAGETASPANLVGGTGLQGYPGGNVTLGGGNGSAGGGGAGGAGQPASAGGSGGASYQWLDGNWYAGGGAGKTGGFGGGQPPANLAMKGGGGDFTSGSPPTSPGSGVAGTGGGGGAAVAKTFGPGLSSWSATPQSAGGSGIVVLRYPNTLPLATSTTGTNTVVYANANIYYRFTGSGTITF